MEKVTGIWANKREGQHFLVDREIAAIEAGYASGMRALEMGAGLGMLTEELCKRAARVVAVEKDSRLCEMLRERLSYKNLELIEGDFFEMAPETLGKVDIMVSNIPYALSSKVISWLGQARIPALLCVQREFAEHMCAKPGSRSYSRLSVLASLRFRVYIVRNVPSSCFHPRPRVDSALVYMTEKNVDIGEKAEGIITMLMNHKKKTVRNALADSEKELGLGRNEIDKLLLHNKNRGARVFQLNPDEILGIAREVAARA
jgi:16S rRNA (adenine1518-N6/adenine1519-N6)-dimethyltransferase